MSQRRRRRRRTISSPGSDPPGLLDTNVFVHSYTHDAASEECRHFLAALEQGTVQARLEPLILHELSYILPRYVKEMTRGQVAAYLLLVLSWQGVQGEKALMADAVERRRDTPRLAFVDAYLAAMAIRERRQVYTKNVVELERQGALVPQPLPAGQAANGR